MTFCDEESYAFCVSVPQVQYPVFCAFFGRHLAPTLVSALGTCLILKEEDKYLTDLDLLHPVYLISPRSAQPTRRPRALDGS